MRQSSSSDGAFSERHPPGGHVSRIEIIDFKTDSVESPPDLITRYSGQMEAYRRAMLHLHPGAETTCILLSVKHGELIRF